MVQKGEKERKKEIIFADVSSKPSAPKELLSRRKRVELALFVLIRRQLRDKSHEIRWQLSKFRQGLAEFANLSSQAGYFTRASTRKVNKAMIFSL